MFKKPFNINQTHKISGADRKKIRRAVERSLQLPNGSDGLEQLLPTKAGELELAKLPAPSRTVIYLLDGIPVLLDTSSKSDFVPTVTGLWRCPQLLPQVYLKHSQVSLFIVSGADLMLPGVNINSLPDFQQGQLVSICVPGNPAPIAVGSATVDSSTALKLAAGQGKGKIVEMLVHYGDQLWQTLGGRAVPNEGFLEDAVVALDALAAQDNGQKEDANAAAAAASDLEQLSDASSSGGATGSTPELAAQPSSDQAEWHAVQQNGAAPSTSGSSRGLSWPDDMDKLLEVALLQALHRSVKDADLPLNSSSLWSQHITHSRPPGSTLDIKKSSHKKMSKFLQVYSKQGLISTKEDKHSGNTIVTGINRNHTLLADYRPYKTADGAAAGPQLADTAPASGGTAVPIAPLAIEEVYKPTKEVKAVFEAVGASSDALYSASAAAAVASDYAKQAQLDQMTPDNTVLVLDATLCDALYKGVIKKGELYPTHIAKAELRKAFLRRLQGQTCISRGQQQIVRKGQPPTVQISGERRQGNKFVTRVVGIEAFLVDPTALAAECQRKYACSTTVNGLPGKNNTGQEVILQGNVVDKLPDHLINTYGIPKKYFLVKKL